MVNQNYRDNKYAMDKKLKLYTHNTEHHGNAKIKTINRPCNTTSHVVVQIIVTVQLSYHSTLVKK